MELHDSMHNSLISSLARKVDQLQFAAFDEELANEDLVDFIRLPESEPEEDSGFDFSETEDEEEAAAEDDELSQAAVHGQSASIDLDEDDGLGEALGFFQILRRHFLKCQRCSFGLNVINCLYLAFWQSFSLKNFAGQVPPAESSADGGCPLEMETYRPVLALTGGKPPIFRGSVEPWLYLKVVTIFFPSLRH